jgi:hypothetical protein
MTQADTRSDHFLSGRFLGGTPPIFFQKNLALYSYFYTRAVWKVGGLEAVRHYYAEGGGDCYAKF